MNRFDRDGLARGATELGLGLTDAQIDRFARYATLLEEWNERINLTRIPFSEVVPLQFLDSLTVHRVTPLESMRTLIDVGTGAGFPGMPLAIAAPDLAVTLLDSTRKKLDFLAAVVADLGLKNVTIRHARAEDAARDTTLRERFDCATARAVAPLEVLAEWLLPFVRIGGTAVALKSESIDPELDQARPAIGEVGGSPPRICPLLLPGTAITRAIVVIEKRRPTPGAFPHPATKARRRRRGA